MTSIALDHARGLAADALLNTNRHPASDPLPAAELIAKFGVAVYNGGWDKTTAYCADCKKVRECADGRTLRRCKVCDRQWPR